MPRRLIPFIIAVIIAAAGIAVIVILLSRAGPTPAVTRAVSTPASISTSVPPTTESPPTALVPPAAPTTSPPVPLPPRTDADLVVLVNGQAVRRSEAERATVIDATMAALVGIPPEGDPLSRLVNQTLVIQAARAEGFVLSQAEVDAALDAFLRQHRLSEADLEAALGEHGVSMAAFREYFAALVTVSRFVAREARTQGITPDEYVARLQADARISFGPAALDLEAKAALPEPLTPTPAPTPTPPQVASGGHTPTAAPARGLNPGLLAPDFSLPTLDGDTLAWADLVGRPTVLSFFTTWCPYCRRQTPVLVEAHREYGDRVQFVGVDVREEEAVVRDYVRKQGIRYPVLLDSEGRVASLYRITGFPITYFLDAEGRVVARHIGALTAPRLKQYLKKVQEER